jgi:hypothetical protein
LLKFVHEIAPPVDDKMAEVVHRSGDIWETPVAAQVIAAKHVGIRE